MENVSGFARDVATTNILIMDKEPLIIIITQKLMAKLLNNTDLTKVLLCFCVYPKNDYH